MIKKSINIVIILHSSSDKIMAIIRKIILVLIFFLLTGAFFVQKVNAASLVQVSDTLTTSRPSAAATLSANIGVGVGTAQIGDKGDFFLASDSAVIYPETGETIDTGMNVASMSATGIPFPGHKQVFFTNTFGSIHHRGEALIVNVTAKHTITFRTVSTIEANGWITITFPGAGSNTASPSATGFSFNNLLTGNVTFSGTGVACSGANLVVSTPTITCHTTTQINGNTVVTATVGSTTPQLINPVKTAAAGTADSWKVAIQTQNASLVNLDYGAAKAATVESVQVQALVEPTITFTIAGVPNGGSTNFNALGTVAGAVTCGSEFSNTGIDSTATFVNLGILNPGGPNKVAQTLTVSTNGATGYAITATTSGRFINPQSGVWLPDGNGGNGLTPGNDQPAPAAIPANGTAFFGISPCGADVPTSIWGGPGTTTMAAASATVSNPWNFGTNSFYATIASHTTGAVSGAVTVTRYGAEASTTTQAGIYTTTVTYVATATF